MNKQNKISKPRKKKEDVKNEDVEGGRSKHQTTRELEITTRTRPWDQIKSR